MKIQNYTLFSSFFYGEDQDGAGKFCRQIGISISVDQNHQRRVRVCCNSKHGMHSRKEQYMWKSPSLPHAG